MVALVDTAPDRLRDCGLRDIMQENKRSASIDGLREP